VGSEDDPESYLMSTGGKAAAPCSYISRLRPILTVGFRRSISVYPSIYPERVKKTTKQMFRRSGLLFTIGTEESRFETGV
jgi:hypothetical protein